jgi:hypothetical protein
LNNVAYLSVVPPVPKYPPVLSNKSEAWAKARGFLKEAIAACDGTYSEDDILKAVLDGRYALFLGERSAMVCSFENFPRMKVIHGFLAGGELEEVKAMEADISEQAGRNGFQRVELSGRRGFLKVFPGYRELCTTIIKDL